MTISKEELKKTIYKVLAEEKLSSVEMPHKRIDELSIPYISKWNQERKRKQRLKYLEGQIEGILHRINTDNGQDPSKTISNERSFNYLMNRMIAYGEHVYSLAYYTNEFNSRMDELWGVDKQDHIYDLKGEMAYNKRDYDNEAQNSEYDVELYNYSEPEYTIDDEENFVPVNGNNDDGGGRLIFGGSDNGSDEEGIVTGGDGVYTEPDDTTIDYNNHGGTVIIGRDDDNDFAAGEAQQQATQPQSQPQNNQQQTQALNTQQQNQTQNTQQQAQNTQQQTTQFQNQTQPQNTQNTQPQNQQQQPSDKPYYYDGEPGSLVRNAMRSHRQSRSNNNGQEEVNYGGQYPQVMRDTVAPAYKSLDDAMKRLKRVRKLDENVGKALFNVGNVGSDRFDAVRTRINNIYNIMAEIRNELKMAVEIAKQQGSST